MTIFPFTLGSHFAKSMESLIVGKVIRAAVTPFFPVPGFQANWVACKEAILGEIMSTCVMPLSHPRHVPHC